MVRNTYRSLGHCGSLMVLVLVFMIVQGLLNRNAFAMGIRMPPYYYQSNKTYGYPMINASVEKLRTMDHETLNKYLSIQDLTDKSNGIHAINLLIDRLKVAFSNYSYPNAQIKTSNRISDVNDEFDKLYIPLSSRQRCPEYVRYIDGNSLLRSHTTPILHSVLQEVKQKNISDMLVFGPGICYLRSTIDKSRVGEPHKMDIWGIKKINAGNKNNELFDLIKVIVSTLSPNAHYRTNSTAHPYTANGLVVEVEATPNKWLKIFECGEASPQLLQDAGLNPNEYSVVGAGLGLERCIMHVKKIDDIRALRSENPEIRKQMEDLETYKPAAEKHESFYYEFSTIVPQVFTKEDICEVIRFAMGPTVNDIEQVNFIEELLMPVRTQKKVVLKVTFNSLDRVLNQKTIDSFISRINKQFNELDCEVIT